MAKLLHISGNTYPPLDKKEHHTKRIWKELANGFEEYHILARSEDNKYRYSKEGNIHLHLVPRITRKSKVFFFSSFWMFYLIKKYKITHLLAQCPIVGGFTTALASRFYKIPLMVEIHGEEYFRFLRQDTLYGKINSSIIRFTFNTAQKIRSLNSMMTQKLRQYGIKKQIVEIPNRVNLKIFTPSKEDYILHTPLQLISVGRFVKEKDYLNLIKNLEAISIEYHLTLIGGGMLKKDYLDYLEEEKIKNKVTLIDWIEQKDMVDVIRESDIYIQSSISEGMPRTIVEAMALKMPIISTKVGSIEGVLNHMCNSILIGSNSKEQIAQAIDTLVNNINLRESLSQQAYQDILEKYEWNKVFDLYRNEIFTMKEDN